MYKRTQLHCLITLIKRHGTPAEVIVGGERFGGALDQPAGGPLLPDELGQVAAVCCDEDVRGAVGRGGADAASKWGGDGRREGAGAGGGLGQGELDGGAVGGWRGRRGLVVWVLG